MSRSTTRVRALYRKELREYRRSAFIVATMAIIPLGMVIFPLILVIALPASDANSLGGDPLLILLGIPALVPTVVASYAVVGERLQGTLEPVLTTPIRREELLLAKALAALVPTLTVAYAVYALFVAATRLFAQPAVASAVLQGPDLLAQVLFTPLVAAWSIWVGIAISTRSSDVRVAQQLSTITGLPTILVAYLMTFNVIHATLGLALGVAAVLLVLDGLGGGLWQRRSTANDCSRAPEDEVQFARESPLSGIPALRPIRLPEETGRKRSWQAPHFSGILRSAYVFVPLSVTPRSLLSSLRIPFPGHPSCPNPQASSLVMHHPPQCAVGCENRDRGQTRDGARSVC